MNFFTMRSRFVLSLLGASACSSTSNGPFGPLDGGADAQPVDSQPVDAAPVDAAPGDSPAADRPVVPDGGTVTPARVLSFGGSPERTMANRNETRLTPAALRGGGFSRDMAFAPQLTGALYSQPLYVPGVMVGGARRDVLFVATEGNVAFALDALTGAEIWNTPLGPTVARSAQMCGNISTIGVTSTGVIDIASNTLYLVSFNSDGGLRFRIHALDLATGAERSGYPAPIRPPAVGASSFDERATGQRGALAFRDGRVYVPFGGLYGDCGIYHGWVVGISATNPTQQTSFATPGRGSGVWAPGGFAMDGMGRLFVATGNSTPLGGHTAGSLGEFVLRLSTGASGPTYTPDSSEDSFSPSDARSLDLMDLDIGSVAPVVLPSVTGAPPLLAQGGKAGTVYLLNADNLGGGTALFSQRVCTGGVFGGMASWSNGAETYVFVPARGTRSGCSGSNGVMALRVESMGEGARFTTAWCTASVSGANPPAVSSNGNADGVLWVTGANTGGGSASLRAYEISSGEEIYGNTDAPPSVRQWVPPLVADGRVYVTGASGIAMYRMQ